MDRESPLERIHYFSGQILSPDDLRVEQDYFLARLRRHNRYLHGWGVVTGLAVSVGEAGDVRVDPGLAIDCVGNEIVVPAPQKLSIDDGLERGFVSLVHVETKTSPTPVTTDDPEASTAFTRIREGFRLAVSPDGPCPEHERMGPGTAGCGLPHPICIARLRRWKRHGWFVEARGRRHG